MAGAGEKREQEGHSHEQEAYAMECGPTCRCEGKKQEEKGVERDSRCFKILWSNQTDHTQLHLQQPV